MKHMYNQTTGIVTTRIVDGYTGEILQEVGQVYTPIDNTSHISYDRQNDVYCIYYHVDFSWCNCIKCG